MIRCVSSSHCICLTVGMVKAWSLCGLIAFLTVVVAGRSDNRVGYVPVAG